jgi:hypothetical protein
MDISFALLLSLLFAIFAQAHFLQQPQFMSCNLDLEMLALVLPLSSASVPPSAFLNQVKYGGACATVPAFRRFFLREAALELACAWRLLPKHMQAWFIA